MLKIGVLVSGGGTNLQAIIDNIKNGVLDNVEIACVVSSRSNAYALERAKENDIKTYTIIRKNYSDQISYDDALIKVLDGSAVDLVVLAGYMVILGERFVDSYKNKIINIHPSLIPAFCGKGFYGIIPHREALSYGVKVSGATVHFVDTETDTGPIIIQKAINIDGIDDEEELQKTIMEKCEWDILPKAIKLISENRINVKGRKVYIDKKGS